MASPVEEIKNRIDIVEFIGSYVRLQKAGANFKAPCPFHNEKTPSFVVSPARQIWHCFGCAKGGDIFRFLMEIDGVDFPDALKTLADRAGIELKREDPAVRSERNRQITMLEDAACFFESNLPKEPSVLEYLIKRGIKSDTIKEWRIGFAASDWEGLTKYLQERGFRGEEMERAGLAIKSNASAQSKTATARYYDRFRGRVIFPICDYQGRVIAFGGRMFPDRENEAKYINSPETALYQKGKILYGLDKAKTHILKAGNCIIVEGYMDVIMSWQAGAQNVVASSGTALTLDQLKMIGRLSDKIIAAFDMDIAGQAATKRGIELALKDGFNISVIDLGDIKDPADAVAKDPALWTHAIGSARHIVQFYIDSAMKKYGPNTPEGKREAETTIIPVVASLASELERAHWVRELSHLLNVQESIVWNAVLRLQRSGQAGVAVMSSFAAAVTKPRRELLEERVLAMLIKYPELLSAGDHVLDPAFFSGNMSRVWQTMQHAPASDDAALRELMLRLALEADLLSEGVHDVNAEFLKLRNELEKEFLKDTMAQLALRIQYAEKNNDPHMTDLLNEFSTVSHKLSQLR